MDYFRRELQRNHQAAKLAPAAWLPWNYKEALAAKDLPPSADANPPPQADIEAVSTPA